MRRCHASGVTRVRRVSRSPGLAEPADEERCEEGGGPGGFSVCLYRDGQLVAVESLNQPRAHMLARKELSGAWSGRHSQGQSSMIGGVDV